MEVALLLHLLEKLHEIGLREFTLCDTIGVAYPKQVEQTIDAVRRAFPQSTFYVHIHDTRNMGMLNSYVAVQCGIDGVHTAIGGMVGCSFAPGVSGNTSSAVLVYMIERHGFVPVIDFDRLLQPAQLAQGCIAGAPRCPNFTLAARQPGFIYHHTTCLF